MRIGLDANSILRNRGGIGWHTYHLLRSLVELKDDDTEYVAYIEPGAVNADVLNEPWAQTPRVRWVEASRWTMPLRGRFDRLDLFHGPNFKVRAQGRSGAVVTIHDLWLARSPRYSRKLFGQWLSSSRTKRIARSARKVITVSEYSAHDIVELYGVPRENIAVIHNGVSDQFRPTREPAAFRQLRQRGGWAGDRFILFVGGADPRKNHRTVVEAYRRRAEHFQGYMLVMVGAPTHHFGNMHETILRAGLDGRAVCTGPLSAQELRLLYAHTELFVFPSLYEGFGMPVLEAMACGAPVITSNTTSLPEVAGDAALLVNPNDPGELAEAMVHVLTNDSLRETLRMKGVARAKQFTWERAARRTLAVYREVCG